MNQLRIALIGSGNMARSLIGGLIANGTDPSCITAADPSDGQRNALAATFGIETFEQNAQAARDADVVVFAVKPGVLREVALELASQTSDKLFISIAAGIRADDLQRWLGGDYSIVRAMPNSPALLGCGVSGLYANKHVTDEQRDTAESILRAVGAAIWLDDEHMINAVTAVSGSGPAYYFLFMEAIADTARKLGFDSDVARLLSVETALGAARMALETSEDLATLRRHVTTPGGTTTAALELLDTPGLRNLIEAALRAADQRAAELADEFGRD